MNKVKNIIIFGGGTSGWLTAAFLTKNLKVPTKITLIEDAAAGPIGVGEGTQPSTAQFLWNCGIEPKEWMKSSNASFKYGVELTGWNEEPYFVDNDTIENTLIANDLFVSDYFIDKPYSEFLDWLPSYRLAKQNLSPKFQDHLDVNFRMSPEHFGAVHFSALNIIKTIKKIIGEKINYVDTKIESVESDQNGITKLIDIHGNEYSSDLYIDCSGFNSLLLEKELGVEFYSYDKWLLNDRAVTIQTQFNDPVEDCFPYTKATAMNCGWRFTIPIHTRTGNGYIYSSKYLTEEQAEKELRESINEYESPAKHLKMKCGMHQTIAYKNVCAVGLSAGFVEPLEATGITFTTSVVVWLTNELNSKMNFWDDNVKESINKQFNFLSAEILSFVWSHYYFSTKSDTDYWKDIRKQKIEDMPHIVQMTLQQFLPEPKRFLLLTENSMFNITQWFSMLHAGGAYKGVKSKLSDQQKQYAEYFIESNKKRLEIAEKSLEKQYDYLNRWYSE